MVALPDASPQPGCVMLTVCVNAVGPEMIAPAILEQLLFALTVTSYVPGASPVMVCVVCAGVVFQM